MADGYTICTHGKPIGTCDDCAHDWKEHAALMDALASRDAQLAAKDALIGELVEALERIAEYGEAHGGYVNAQFDGRSLSWFARAAVERARAHLSDDVREKWPSDTEPRDG